MIKTMRELIEKGHVYNFAGWVPTVFWLHQALEILYYGNSPVMCADIDNTKSPVLVTTGNEAYQFYEDISQDTYDELDWTKMYPWLKDDFEPEIFEWIPIKGVPNE